MDPVSNPAILESSLSKSKNENSDLLILAVATEADINELDNFDDRKAFLDDIGLSEAGSSKLIKKSYDLLSLQTYFTAGVKEVRAWTINKGMTAPQAAGVIHTDFEKGFIRAEVISFKDYTEYKSEIKVKELGRPHNFKRFHYEVTIFKIRRGSRAPQRN